MAEIVKFYPRDAADDPKAVLEYAAEEEIYNDVLIIGWDKDNQLNVRSSNKIARKDALWLLQLVSRKLIDGDYHDSWEY